VAFSVIWFLQ